MHRLLCTRTDIQRHHCAAISRPKTEATISQISGKALPRPCSLTHSFPADEPGECLSRGLEPMKNFLNRFLQRTQVCDIARLAFACVVTSGIRQSASAVSGAASIAGYDTRMLEHDRTRVRRGANTFRLSQ